VSCLVACDGSPIIDDLRCHLRGSLSMPMGSFDTFAAIPAMLPISYRRILDASIRGCLTYTIIGNRLSVTLRHRSSSHHTSITGGSMNIPGTLLRRKYARLALVASIAALATTRGATRRARIPPHRRHQPLAGEPSRLESCRSVAARSQLLRPNLSRGQSTRSSRTRTARHRDSSPRTRSAELQSPASRSRSHSAARTRHRIRL
jgi:hypothetical protein